MGSVGPPEWGSEEVVEERTASRGSVVGSQVGDSIAELQRALGNRQLGRLLRCCGVAGGGCERCRPDGGEEELRKLLALAASGRRLARQVAEAVQAPLTAPLWADNPRIQSAARNAPPLTAKDSRENIALLQQALASQDIPMPRSTRTDGSMDGVWGEETTGAVRAFQEEAEIRPVGGWEAGRKTLTALDARLTYRPFPPRPRPDVDGSTEGVTNLDVPVLGRLLLAFNMPAGATRSVEDGGPAPTAYHATWKGSVAESVFQLVRWLPGADDKSASEATNALLTDGNTLFDGARADTSSFDAKCRRQGYVVIQPGAVRFLCDRLNAGRANGAQQVSPDDMPAALEAERKFSAVRETADRWRYYGEMTTAPTDPRETHGAKQQAGRKRRKLEDDFSVLQKKDVASVYVLMLGKYAKPKQSVEQMNAMAADGLTLKEVGELIDNDPRRRLVTQYFTQGAKEYWDSKPGADRNTVDVEDFKTLEDVLLAQLFWGNPTVVKNDLGFGIGIPEMEFGLVYRPDNTLFYSLPLGEPLRSVAGGRFRDPGFKPGGKDFGKILNVDDIHDDVIKGFFKLLHDSYAKGTELALRGADAYWQNREAVDDRIKTRLPKKLVEDGYPAELAAEFGMAVVTLIGFLTYKAIAMALERTKSALLQAVGASMDVLAEGARFLLQLDFMGSLEGTLVEIGYQLVHVIPPEEGKKEYDPLSEGHLIKAADKVVPIIIDILVQLVVAAAAKGVSRQQALRDPRARKGGKAKLESVTNKGGRGRVLCRACWLEVEAAEYSKSTGRDYYDMWIDDAVKRGYTRGKPFPHPKFPGVEIHPDGNWYGTYDELRLALDAERLSRGGRIGHDVQAHHIMEKTQLRPFGISDGEGWSAALESIDHSDFSSYMSGIREGPMDIDEIYEFHRGMYEFLGHPEYIEQMRRFMRMRKQHFINLYQSGNVPTARNGRVYRKDTVLEFLRNL